MVYTINLKSGTFRGDYEPWEVTFRENVESRAKVRCPGTKIGSGGRGPGRGPGAGGARGVPDLCRVIRALTG